MSESVAPTWVITDHAITRYIQRVRQRATYEQAIADIMRLLARAHLVKDCGDYELWRTPRPERLRIRAVRNGDRLEVATILFAFDR